MICEVLLNKNIKWKNSTQRGQYRTLIVTKSIALDPQLKWEHLKDDSMEKKIRINDDKPKNKWSPSNDLLSSSKRKSDTV